MTKGNRTPTQTSCCGDTGGSGGGKSGGEGVGSTEVALGRFGKNVTPATVRGFGVNKFYLNIINRVEENVTALGLTLGINFSGGNAGLGFDRKVPTRITRCQYIPGCNISGYRF
ncbi:MAG: hypothetical protein RSE13_24920 [Planktothrix sp. GU0601_MAG3]|nr:MAG: hypothetical protein RSE13_24920 [Planktothrix sp. GU0601_MAG3]